MKYLVEYDSVTGNITDSKGFILIGAGVGMIVEPFKPQTEQPKTNIDDIIKLKASGFTADDVVKMGFKL